MGDKFVPKRQYTCQPIHKEAYGDSEFKGPCKSLSLVSHIDWIFEKKKLCLSLPNPC